MAGKVIEVKNLVKQYDHFRAVDNLSFSVRRGEIFGLLGENGAGKTTTLEIIEGLRQPSSGEVMVLGADVLRDLKKIKERIGVQLQSSAYYNFLTLKEILKLFGGFYQRQLNPDHLLEMVDLSFKSNELVRTLSGGQKQRFSIIASLVNDPEIVFLDEPTTGLDPLARRNLWELVVKIKEQGKTIVLTTHYMEEAEVLCDRVAIMDKGKILVIGETHKLVEKIPNPYKIRFIAKALDKNGILKLKKIGAVSGLKQEKGFEMRLPNHHTLYEALREVMKIKPESLSVVPASLEDLFIELTGKRIEE